MPQRRLAAQFPQRCFAAPMAPRRSAAQVPQRRFAAQVPQRRLAAQTPQRRLAAKGRRCRRGVLGTTLVEALIAFLALCFGAVALARLQADLRLGAGTARQRAEAVSIAEDEFERLRSFASVAASSAGPSYADVVPATRTVDPSPDAGGSSRLTVERDVRPAGVASAREVTVVVRWHDATGTPQRVVLASMIAADDPGLGGALALMPAGPPAAAAAPPP